MSEHIEFVSYHHDLGNDKGFQFEILHNRGGTSFRPQCGAKVDQKDINICGRSQRCFSHTMQ